MSLLSLRLILLVLTACHSLPQPRLVATISQKLPGFLSLVPSTQKNIWSLAVSSFDGAPFSSDYAYYYPKLKLDPSTPFVTLNNTNLHWPNEITYITESVLGNSVDPYGGLLIASGFLVPSKGNGGIFYYPFTDSSRLSVSSHSHELSNLDGSASGTWFYHRVRLVDLTGDGKKDLITCRANKPLIGSAKQQMVIFTFDGQGKVTTNVILSQGCDVFFQVVDLDHDGRLEILSSVFFTKELVLIWTEDPSNNYLNASAVRTRVVENQIGAVFDVRTYDFDLDGYDEVVITNHQGNSASVKGSLFLYSIPRSSWKTSPWKQTVLYNNFPVVLSGPNQAAPGAPVVFYPLTNHSASDLPWIAVAGDGASAAYVFAPSSSGYDLVWKYDFPKCTVGGITVEDVDGDGYSELFIPTYESNSFSVFTFSPSARNPLAIVTK